jgi:hypothetical protein
MMVQLDDTGTRFICRWYAKCDRAAEWVTRGPIGDGLFGEVPICQRCADKLGIADLRSYQITQEAS